MFETAAILAPILIADIVNPVLFGLMVYASGSGRPILHSISLLLGHTAAYFCAGIVIALGLESLTSYLANPSIADYFIGLVVGILLLWVAYRSATTEDKGTQEQGGALTPLSAFGLGAVANVVGIPFALPYFAAIGQIMKADLTTFEALAVLTAYNVLYAVPFLLPPALVAILGEQSLPLLRKINGVLDRASSYLMPALLGILGAALIIDAILFFSTGEGLY